MNSILKKKTQIQLTGKWRGVIVYGSGYGENLVNKKLYFTVVINELNGVFTGTAIDTGGVGVNPDTAIINGFIDGEKIRFTKQYKTKLFIEENQATSIEQNRPGPEVTYNGVYEEGLQRFSGEWKIMVEAHHFGEDGWKGDAWKGNWKMKRIN